MLIYCNLQKKNEIIVFTSDEEDVEILKIFGFHMSTPFTWHLQEDKEIVEFVVRRIVKSSVENVQFVNDNLLGFFRRISDIENIQDTSVAEPVAKPVAGPPRVRLTRETFSRRK